MRYSLVLLIVAFLVFGGCSKALNVALTGTPEMNNGGNAAVVKVYQLKGNSSFEKVPASAFWRNDTKALGGALLTEPKKVTLYPADSTSLQLELVKKAKYIGVAANLRNPEREQWRSSYAVKKMGNQVWVTVQDRKVNIRVDEKGVVGQVSSLF